MCLIWKLRDISLIDRRRFVAEIVVGISRISSSYHFSSKLSCRKANLTTTDNITDFSRHRFYVKLSGNFLP